MGLSRRFWLLLSSIIVLDELGPATSQAQPMPTCATMAAIGCGATSSGTISTTLGNVANCHTFAANVGEVVSIGVARQGGGDLRPAWKVFDGTGTAIDTTCNANVSACQDAVTLSGTPPYTITISDFDFNTTGSYSVTLEPLSATFAGATSCASPLSCGVAIANVISQTSDVDTYRFNASAGEIVTIGAAIQQVGFLKPGWRLYNAAGSLVESACDADVTSCRRTVVLASTGQYTIKVGDFGLGESGAYSLALQAVSATLDGAPNCAEPIDCGGSPTATLTHNASIDTYGFAAVPGETVSIGVSRQAVGFLNPAWTLFDASGTAIGSACDADASACQSNVTLSGSSPYTLMVSDFDVSTAGSYSVTLEPVSATFAGAPSCALLLDCGIPASASIGNRSDIDAYSIAANPGEAVAIAVARESGNFLNPAWILYDAAGTLVDSSCDLNASSCQASVTLAGPSPYTLSVSDFDLGETGNYSVAVHAISDTYDGGPPCGTPIDCGQPQQTTLSARADIDGYRFSVSAGDVVSITAARQGGGDLVPEWTLHDSDGAELGACSTGAASCTADALLTGTPPYTVSVSMRGLNTAGNYTVEVASGNCCQLDAECSGNVCTTATCNASGFCPVQNLVACNDGLACTSADTCNAGECVGTDNCPGGEVCNPVGGVCVECVEDLDCDDGNVCTSEVCDPSNVCVLTPTTLACDDGVFCNGLDTCAGGGCSAHAGDPCDNGTGCVACNEGPQDCVILSGSGCASDGNSCTDDVCDDNGFCAHQPNSGPCSDGLTCTSADTCVAGVCVGQIPGGCVDADPCTLDACNDIDGCVNSAEPATDCKVAGRSQFTLKDRAVDTRDQLRWRWQRGEETMLPSLGNPELDTVYSLCIFDTSAGSPVHVATLTAPAGSTAWSPTRSGDGFIYTDRQRLIDGLDTIKVVSGAAGRARVEIKASGVFLPDPTPFSPTEMFDEDPGVIVQLVTSAGMCWGSEYETAQKNSVDEFRAREP